MKYPLLLKLVLSTNSPIALSVTDFDSINITIENLGTNEHHITIPTSDSGRLFVVDIINRNEVLSVDGVYLTNLDIDLIRSFNNLDAVYLEHKQTKERFIDKFNEFSNAYTLVIDLPPNFYNFLYGELASVVTR